MFETIIDGVPHDHESDTTPPVKSVSIANLISVRDGIRERFETVARLLNEAREMAKGSGLGFPRIEMDHHQHGKHEMSGPTLAASLMKQVDATGWDYLMKESGLLTFMDTAARRDWSEKVYALNVPELTEANIGNTFASLHGLRGDMLDRGVINVFRSLSWDYKTNLPHKFGKKIIVNRLASLWGTGNRYLSFIGDTCSALDDLDRVFYKLASLPEPDHRDGWNCRLNAAQREKNPIADGRFFTVKWFKKGSGHVVFKNPADADKLNSILARHFPNALPPSV